MDADDFNSKQLANGTLTMRHISELVKDFQDWNGLNADGKAGPETIRALNGYPVKVEPMPPRCFPLPILNLPTGSRYPQVTSTGHWTNPDRPTHNGVDLFYPYKQGDPETKVGDGFAARGHDGKPKWWIPDKTCAIASARGVVEFSGPGKTGTRVWIRHLNSDGGLGRWSTGYFHLRSTSLKAGQTIDMEEPVGEVGDNPVDIDAEHLHFEVIDGLLTEYPESLIDPMTWLQGALFKTSSPG